MRKETCRGRKVTSRSQWKVFSGQVEKIEKRIKEKMLVMLNSWGLNLKKAQPFHPQIMTATMKHEIML